MSHALFPFSTTPHASLRGFSAKSLPIIKEGALWEVRDATAEIAVKYKHLGGCTRHCFKYRIQMTCPNPHSNPINFTGQQARDVHRI